MSNSQGPRKSPSRPLEVIDEMEAEIKELRHRAACVMDISMAGPRGQDLTVADARDRGEKLVEAINMEQAAGSQRHRRVPTFAKALVLLVVVVIDFPIIEWLCGSLLNVDWSDPLGVPLATSVAVSTLATSGAGAALYQLGRDQRQYKDHHRHIDMTIGAKVSLVGVGALLALIPLVMYYRLYPERAGGGLNSLENPQAIVLTAVMLISEWLVFWAAFRDGSPELDDLRDYTRLIQPYMNLKRSYEDRANNLEQQAEILRLRTYRPNAWRYGGVTDKSHRERSPYSAPLTRITADLVVIKNLALDTGRGRLRAPSTQIASAPTNTPGHRLAATRGCLHLNDELRRRHHGTQSSEHANEYSNPVNDSAVSTATGAGLADEPAPSDHPGHAPSHRRQCPG